MCTRCVRRSNNAIDGNLGTNVGLANVQGSWEAAGSPMDLGAWGVDTTTHTVWAVIDHNSQFSVIPEPTTMGLLILGAILAAFRHHSGQSSRR